MNLHWITKAFAIVIAATVPSFAPTLARAAVPPADLVPLLNWSLFNVTAHAMPLCPAAVPNKPFPTGAKIDFIVRVVIPNPYTPAKTARSVFVKPPVGNEASADGDGADPDFGAPMLSSIDGPFHIDFSRPLPQGIPTVPAKGLSYVEVRVILMDKGLQFVAKTFPSIGYSDKSNNLNMCGLMPDETAHGHEVRVFFVPMRKPSHDGTWFSSYNIGVEPPGAATPTYIDPKVINNGVTLLRKQGN
jgi:hypothetical protein